MPMRLIYILTILFLPSFLSAQKTGKKLVAGPLVGTITIDGKLDDPAWQTAPVAEDFIQLKPNPAARPSQKTIVRVLYNTKAVYVSAYMYDTLPEKISRQLSKRDKVDNADWFYLTFCPYQDGQNGTGFAVTASGVQLDIKLLPDGEDFSWDAVWRSAISFPGDGWIVEMEIPYSALRFPVSDKQEWGINFGRNIRRVREESWWNPIDPAIEGVLNQTGTLTGIENIQSPLRLSVNPYLSTYIQWDKDPQIELKQNSTSLNGGMDVKYGINDAFTIDMTLIPDFGQTRFDNKILNVSPFEIQYAENRPFFTEGIELFNKGSLFYSRRIGADPYYLEDLENGLLPVEKITEYPIQNRLINALKFSGRTEKGLGIGIFNAIESKTFAKIINEETQLESKSLINPFSNYSVAVLDQNLKNNSSVTLVNTNVTRSGENNDANVSSLQYNLRDKSNTYFTSGNFNYSRVNANEPQLAEGYQWSMYAGKNSGTWNYQAGYNASSPKYNPNDLGFLAYTNFRRYSAELEYNIFKPFGAFNELNTSLNFEYNRLMSPGHFTDSKISLEWFTNNKKFHAFGGFIGYTPSKTYDYFEPRTSDYSRFLLGPEILSINPWISSDYSKKFAIDAGISYVPFNSYGRKNNNFYISPRYRFSDKFKVVLNQSWSWQYNNPGFVRAKSNAIGYETLQPDDILFGERNLKIVETTITAEYAFNNKMVINLEARHYWNTLRYLQFKTLAMDGTLENSAYLGVDDKIDPLHNINFNIMNIDLTYSWRFAPGSDIFLVYKQFIKGNEQQLHNSYPASVRGLFAKSESNNISLRIVYYLDYQMLKKKK